jgi:hypothetical protein
MTKQVALKAVEDLTTNDISPARKTRSRKR